VSVKNLCYAIVKSFKSYTLVRMRTWPSWSYSRGVLNDDWGCYGWVSIKNLGHVVSEHLKLYTFITMGLWGSWWCDKGLVLGDNGGFKKLWCRNIVRSRGFVGIHRCNRPLASRLTVDMLHIGDHNWFQCGHFLPKEGDVVMAGSFNTATRSRGSNNRIHFEGLMQLINSLVQALAQGEIIHTFIAC
jgi:hypothetical protein